MTSNSASIGATRWPLRLVLALILTNQLVVCLPKEYEMKESQPNDPLGIINWTTFTRMFKKSYSSLTQQLVRHKLFIVRQLQVFIAASKWALEMAPNYLVINKFADLAPHEEMRLLSGNLDDSNDDGDDDEQEGGKPIDDEHLSQLLQEELKNPYHEPDAPIKSSPILLSRRQKRDLGSNKPKATSHIKSSMGLIDLNGFGAQPKIKPSIGLLELRDLVRLPNNEHLVAGEKHPNLKWWVPAENPFYEPLDLFSRGRSADKQDKTIADIPADQLAQVDETATGWLTDFVPGLSGLADLGRSGLSWASRAVLALEATQAGDESNQPSQQTEEAAQNYESKLNVVHKDWRETGCIARPYFQGNCFSCYAISSMAFLEWAYCMSRNQILTPLSAQYLISCGPQFMRESAPRLRVEFNGCNMGRSRHALSFVKEYGAELEMHMPYMAEDTQCPIEPNTPAKYKGYLRPNVKSTIRMSNSTKQLDRALNVGPIIVVFRAPINFMAYGGGMIQSCYSGGSHAMLIVGHGVENNIPYLLIKNSFGTDWGEGGYFKFDRRFTLECVKEFFLPRVRFPSKKSQLRRIKAYNAHRSKANNQEFKEFEPGDFETHIDKLVSAEVNNHDNDNNSNSKRQS